MFTNIPLDLAIHEKRLNQIERNMSIPICYFILEFMLTSTHFTFNKIYKQTFGTLMGSSLSSIIANLLLQDLEEKVLKFEFRIAILL